MSDEKWIVSGKDHLGGKPRVLGTLSKPHFEVRVRVVIISRRIQKRP